MLRKFIKIIKTFELKNGAQKDLSAKKIYTSRDGSLQFADLKDQSAF